MRSGVTIRELAKLAGCTHTTVSMALKNHPRVSEQTRNRIRRLAEKHGYSRDPLLSSLMNQLRAGRRQREVETLGIINYWDTPEGDRRFAFGAEQSEGMLKRAQSMGYQVDYVWAKEPGMTTRRLNRILQARGIRGLLILSMLHARGHISLEWSKFAAVAIGYTLHKPELNRATYSAYHATVTALRTLRRMKYSRIGFTNQIQQEDLVNNERLAAYLGYYHRVLGRAPAPPLLVQDWDRKNLGSWIRENRLEVVLSSNLHTYHVMKEIGFRIPQEVGYVSLDCYPGETPCAGIRQPRDRVGAKAVDLVIEQLEKHEFGLPQVPKVVTIKGYWQDGPTLAPHR